MSALLRGAAPLVAALLVAACSARVLTLVGAPARRRRAETVAGSSVARPGGVHAAVTSRLARWRHGRRTRPATAGEVAGWCDDVARRVRAGDTLARAVVDARAPETLAGELAPITLALARGTSLADAVLRVGAPSAPVAVAIGVVRACASLGGPAAPALDQVGATLRARVADAGERRAQSAQARLSARLLTVLPVGTLLVLATLAPSIRAVLATAPGLGCVVAGAALNGAGWRWMRLIVEGRP